MPCSNRVALFLSNQEAKLVGCSGKTALTFKASFHDLARIARNLWATSVVVRVGVKVDVRCPSGRALKVIERTVFVSRMACYWWAGK